MFDTINLTDYSRYNGRHLINNAMFNGTHLIAYAIFNANYKLHMLD